MRFLILGLFFFIGSVSFSQSGKVPNYLYTVTSEKYITDEEIDSTFHATASEIFRENQVPAELFEKKYPDFKEQLIVLSRLDISRYFRAIEGDLPRRYNIDRNSDSFKSVRLMYLVTLRTAVRNTFLRSFSLSRYVNFNTSDRIKSFHTKIWIQPNGKLLVEERITINNGNGSANPLYGGDDQLEENGHMNNEIKRGIVRAFPLYYVNRFKLFQNTTFDLKSVMRNGKKENYHTERKDNGILIYTGSSDIYLEDGTFSYTLTYETDHQLKLLNDYDELAWNVTGTGWSFRIDTASCIIYLPVGSKGVSNHCYTGAQGSTEEFCTQRTGTIGDTSFIEFRTTRSLAPYQGITVASSWSKGFVTSSRGAWYYIWNNKAVFFLPLATLFTIIFCFFYWRKYGRDPEKGVIYAQFEPPAGYSPAAVGYIYNQAFGRDLTAATIVDAAVRGNIEIKVNREGTFIKHNAYVIGAGDRKKSKAPQTNYNDFYTDVKTLVGTTIQKGKYNSQLGALNKALQKHCEEKYKKKDGKRGLQSPGLFALNRSYTTLPGLLCWIAGIWALGSAIKAATLGNGWQFGYYVVGLILAIIVFSLYSRLLPAYTEEGRKLADKIEGFRLFLATADEQRFDTMAQPTKSLELYEKYLPFAIALGCEIQWGKKFEEIISAAIINGTMVTSSAFAHTFSQNSNSFSSSFASSFSGAITSASSPPSSSSSGGSSFGGGSSGGGGGGGGGGGW